MPGHVLLFKSFLLLKKKKIGAQIIHKFTMPQTTWEFREISHLPICQPFLWKIQLSLGVFHRIEVILFSNGSSLHHVDTNLNCKVRILRKFFANFKKGTTVTCPQSEQK